MTCMRPPHNFEFLWKYLYRTCLTLCMTTWWPSIFQMMHSEKNSHLVSVGTGRSFSWWGGGKDKSVWQCKTDHSPQFTGKIKDDWSYTFTPLIRLHGVGRNTFTLILHLGKQGTWDNTVWRNWWLQIHENCTLLTKYSIIQQIQ